VTGGQADRRTGGRADARGGNVVTLTLSIAKGKKLRLLRFAQNDSLLAYRYDYRRTAVPPYRRTAVPPYRSEAPSAACAGWAAGRESGSRHENQLALRLALL
jgi:hypothetical protein